MIFGPVSHLDWT